MQIIGPFTQILTMDKLKAQGPLKDSELEIIENGGLMIEGTKIARILNEDEFKIFTADINSSPMLDVEFIEMEHDAVLMPGFIDSHTHICFAGSRAQDYARRLSGESYLEIAKAGGGILSTVRMTREANQVDLEYLLTKRAKEQLLRGVTSCEVKSGYGLSLESELKMLRVIKHVSEEAQKPGANLPDLVSTCLAAHVMPAAELGDNYANHKAYLDYVLAEILPAVKSNNLSNRIDIFVEEEAFSYDLSLEFLTQAKRMGFDITVHADQFSCGGSRAAAEIGAISADHLEASTDAELDLLKSSSVIATVLPGASMGLGMPYAPARKILDKGLNLVIASDWNPGSAPMGDLLMQAAVLGASEKLSVAETLAAITSRAAKALSYSDRGVLAPLKLADMIAFNCRDYREICYQQGSLKPFIIWKKGKLVSV